MTREAVPELQLLEQFFEFDRKYPLKRALKYLGRREKYL
jgi:hypothetical protein